MTLHIYENTDHIPPDYWQYVPDFYLQKPYLQALSYNLPHNLKPYYIVGTKNNVAVFGAYLQLYTFDKLALNDLQLTGFLSTRIGKMLAKRFYAQAYSVLVLGNALVTGSHSHWQNTAAHAAEILEMVRDFCKKNIHFDAIVYKDILPETHQKITKKLLLLPTEPTMVLSLPNHWHTPDSYTQALSAKYRTRYKSAVKKMGDIVAKNLKINDLHIYKDKIYHLFGNVFEQGGFKVAKIKADYFIDFKAQFDDNFVVIGYFLGDEMVGFISGFVNENTKLDANYIGINYDYNTTHKLYQNMLYEYVRLGIERRVEKINFSRTALAIKSTLGAQPQALECYIDFMEHCVAQAVFTPIIKRLQTTEFEQRNPFKD